MKVCLYRHAISSLALLCLALLSLIMLALLVVASPSVAHAQNVEEAPASGQQEEQILHLPRVLNDATSLGPFPLVPGPVTALLPDPESDAPALVHPQGGMCAANSHPVHISGFPNLMPGDDPEDGEGDGEGGFFADEAYICQPDQSLETVQCSANGKAVLVGGVASCQCEAGYAGAACNICAPGYQMNSETQSCEVAPSLPLLEIEGSDSSVEAGATTVLVAKNEIDQPVAATWTIATGSIATSAGAAEGSAVAQADEVGCLYNLDGDATCQSTVTGSRVGYRAPATLPDDQQVKMVEINVDPVDRTNFNVTSASIVVIGVGGIPISGYGDARMQPFLDAISRYMRQRCIGGLTLGVSRYGAPLAVYGFGRMDGRAAASWHDYCGDDETAPLANPVSHHTPFRVGSTNKPISFSVLRYTLNRQLQLNDSDLTLTALGDSRLVSAQRTTSGAINLTVWDVDGAGNLVKRGETSVDLGDLEGVAIQARDLELISLADGRVVLGVRDSNNNLRLDAWSVSGPGELSQVAHSLFSGDAYRMVDLTMTPLADFAGANDRFVLARRNSYGATVMEHYRIAQENVRVNAFLVEGSWLNGGLEARDLEIVDASNLAGPRVLLATRIGDSTMRLSTFSIGESGGFFLQDDASTGVVQDMELVRMGPRRVLSALRDNGGQLKLIVWEIADDGTIEREGDATGDAVQKISLAAFGPLRVIVASQLSANNHLQITTWEVNADGSVVSLLDEDEAGVISGSAVQTLTNNRAAVAVRANEGTLKNIVWDMNGGGALTRRGEITGVAAPDSTWSDTAIESLRLAGFELPELLFSERVHAILRGDLEPPVLLPSMTRTEEDDSVTVLCEAMPQYAEPEWQQTTIGHLLRHSMGLPKSAPGRGTQIDSIPLLRGLTTQADYVAQEALLRTEFSDPTVDNAGTVDVGKAQLGYGAGTQIYVVPDVTLEENMLLVLGRCLPNELGQAQYSNTSPAIAALIVQHLVGSFAAIQGYPATHEGSGLDLFFAEMLGVDSTSSTEIYNSQRVLDLSGYTYREPAYREWSASNDTYYWEIHDEKRPHCIWNGSTCDFADWKGADNGRLQWEWNGTGRVPFEFAATSPGEGASGNLSVEPEAFLAFMQKYWVNGASEADDPSIGEERNGVWNSLRAHNGSADGTKARIIQFGTLGNVADTSGDFYALTADLPRKYGQPYFPLLTEDTFGKPASAYFVANAATGSIVTYQPDGSVADTTVGHYAVGDRFAVGRNGFQGVPDSFYVAHHQTGMLEVINPRNKTALLYNIGYDEGDALVVDDLLQNDVYDEIIVGDVSSGEIRVYASWPQGAQNALPLTPLLTVDKDFAVGDKLALGDVTGNKSNEVFIARASTGQVEIYRLQAGVLDNAPWKTLAANYSAEDALAVSDVVGTQTGRDEIIIGNASSHNVEVYNYTNNQYQLYTTFNGLYYAGGTLAVNDLWAGSQLNEILVGVPGYDLTVVFKAAKVDDLFQFSLLDFMALDGEYQSGDGVAAGFWSGLHRYSCSYGAQGISQNDFPNGVDVFVSLNTSADKQCVEEGDCGLYNATMRDRVIKYAMCQINWAEVIPTLPPLILPIAQEGGQ